MHTVALFGSSMHLQTAYTGRLLRTIQAKQIQVRQQLRAVLRSFGAYSILRYRHTYGQAAKKENTYDNIKISASA